jgi:hypothetical protein
VRRNNTTATKRAWLSEFMGFGAGPEPFTGWRDPAVFRRSSISNFAAMLVSGSISLKPANSDTSRIIDAF